MKRQTFLSIFVIAWCVTVLEATAKHEVQKATYQHAVDICSDRGVSLASTEHLRHQLQIDPSNAPFWLPYRKSTSGDWRWINGTLYAKHIINPAGSVAHQDCAVVQSSDRILDESYCFKPTKDFLCDLSGSCPPGQTCITIDNKIRSVHHGKFSWFKARDVCRKLRGDLATFHGKDMQLTIQSIHSALKKQGHFWIGLARKQWLPASTEHLTYYNWASDADDSFGCATISHELAWRTARCENQNAFICNVTTTEGSAVTEQTSIQVTAAERRTGWETTAHPDKVAVSEIPSSSTPDIGSAGAGTIVGIILLVIIVVLLLGFFVLRCFQVTRRQKDPPKNYRETVKKMVFYDKLCKRRDVMKEPNEAEQDGMDDMEDISTNKNPQDSAPCSCEIEEPSPKTPLMSVCTEQHTVAVTNENGSTKDTKLRVRKRPDEADTVQSENALNEKCGNQAEPKSSSPTIKNGSKQILKISDVASKNSVKSSKQFTADSQNDSSKPQKPHLNTKDNLDEQSKCSNIHDEVQDANMTDNSTIPIQKEVLTNPAQANTVRSQVAFNEKKENEAEGKPNLHTIKNGSNKPHKMSNVISDVSITPSKQSTRDSTHDSSEEKRGPLLHVKDNLDKQKKDSNVNGKVEISSVKENKTTNRVDDITTGVQNLGKNEPIPYAKKNSVLTPIADQNSKSNLDQSLFIQVHPDGKQSKLSILVTREENNIKANPSVSESNSHRISQYPSCVNAGQSTDSKEKSQTKKDREEAPTSHTTNLSKKKENEYNMASKKGRKCELPSTQLIQTGKPPHSNAYAEPKGEENNVMPCGKIQEQIYRQNVQEQKPDSSDIHVPKSIIFSQDVKDDLAKLSDQEFADLLKNYSSNKDKILAEYAKNPDIFHQKIDTITTRLSNPLERPRLLHLLQQIAEDSPQVFLERHVRQVGSYVSKDSGEYPVLTVLKYFPTKFPDMFVKIDDTVIKLFEKDGKKLFSLFPKLIGELGSCSKKSAVKHTKLLVKHFALMPVPLKNNLLGCLADIATHFKDVVLVHKDKFENIKSPLHDFHKNKLLEVLGVKSQSQGTFSAQGERGQGNIARTVNEEEKEVILQKGKESAVEGEEIGRNETQGRQKKPMEKIREQNEGKYENKVKTKREEDENVKPKALASATKKGQAPLPPDTKTPPARPLYPPGQSPNSAGGKEMQPSAMDTT